MGDEIKLSPDLPDEIRNFRWDHPEGASQLCNTCHPFGPDRPPVVDTYLNQNPDCTACHSPGSGAPEVTFNDLPQVSHTVTHETPYPGLVATIRKFVANISSFTGFGTNGKGRGTAVSESIKAGFEIKPGDGNRISGRVEAAGQAFVQDETILGYKYDESEFYNNHLSLDSASLGYGIAENGFSLQTEAGLISPVTPLGRNTFLGTSIDISARHKNDDGQGSVATYAYVGNSLYDESDEWLTGAGIQAGQSSDGNSVSGGLDILNSSLSDQPDLALNGGATFSIPEINVSGSCVDKTYLQPTDDFAVLERTENACRVSLGEYVTIGANQFYQPAQSDDVFSGESIEDNHGVRAGVGVQPLPFLRVNYSFGTGTYLLYEHKVVLDLTIANHLGIRPYYEVKKSAVFGTKLETNRVGGELSVDFRDFHTRFGMDHRAGDAVPIFNGMGSDITRLTLSGEYKIKDMTISGHLAADVTNGFQPLSGQLRITIPFGDKVESRDDRFKIAEEAFAVLVREDPMLGAIVNPAIYPRQELPQDLTMHHQMMISAGLSCPTCHSTVESDGQMALPAKALCTSCHHQSAAFMGHKVAINYDPKEIVIPRSFANFDHRIAGHVPEGEVADATCLTCHENVASRDIATRSDLPPMVSCLSACHDQPYEKAPLEMSLDEYLVDEYGLDNSCQVCHVTEPGGKLVTDTPYGLFYPVNGEGYFSSIAHGTPGSPTRNFWYDTHPVKGKEMMETCNSCHGAAGESACAECHGTNINGNKRPDFHEADWEMDHYMSWLQGDKSCGECHEPTQADEMSLCRDCHDSRGLTYNFTHTDGWRYDCTETSPTNAHQAAAWNTGAGPSGGAQLCVACHTPIQKEGSTRQAVGCDSCHGANNLGNCNH